MDKEIVILKLSDGLLCGQSTGKISVTNLIKITLVHCFYLKGRLPQLC